MGSTEAQTFIEDSMVGTWEMIDLSPDGVSVLRSENSDVAKEGWERIQHEVTVDIEEDIIGGISVQWVVPRDRQRDEVVLYLFGGGFICGCPEDDLSMTSRLAQLLGCQICVPRYRLAPEHPYPAALNDVKMVYDVLSRDRDIVVIGESAGGNLALRLVLDVIEKGAEGPKVVALMSPWIDLTHSGESHQVENLDPTLSVPHFLLPASLAYAGEKSTEDPVISPLFEEIPSVFPPITISSGTRDLLLSDCTRLAKKLEENNTVVDLQIREGVWHVFEWYPELPESLESLEHIADFIVTHIEEVIL
eukprot:TRINITY_DN7953_c0_g1_i1.p1 TRINITY_DN7953_c0_g1~~TRINITY_DN7953_c0_g1_i1.p1  ORF type:complete len:305 (-),score=76.09 TRINITY_DN7953_c0_g1_i1:17-931(-)